MRFTPDKITRLAFNEIIVIGTNLGGLPAGRAARTALEKFGAIYGLGEGFAGQSYAFPTFDEKFQKRTHEELLESKHKLYAFAEKNQDKTFLITKLGLGIAGYSIEEMQKVFNGSKPDNVILPKAFYAN